MKSLGFNTFDHAFAGIPHFDITRCVPRDLMHVELEGTLKSHLYGILFMAFKLKWFTLTQLNVAIRTWPFPEGKRPDIIRQRPEGKSMHIQTALLPQSHLLPAGTKHGAPKANKTLRWTASQVLHFVVASVELMGQLMTADQRENIIWQSWIAHVDYFMRLMQTRFTDEGLQHLESSIIHAHKLFQKIPQFSLLWLPKHHFSLHFVEDIRRFGPLRFIWCMRFEAKNQEHKAAAKLSNFHNVAGLQVPPYYCSWLA